jgi:hypothetical protein
MKKYSTPAVLCRNKSSVGESGSDVRAPGRAMNIPLAAITVTRKKTISAIT